MAYKTGYRPGGMDNISVKGMPPSAKTPSMNVGRDMAKVVSVASGPVDSGGGRKVSVPGGGGGRLRGE